MIDMLKKALVAHRAKLEMVEKVAESSSDPMQQLLAIDLDTFDIRLRNWIEIAPIRKVENI